MEVGNQLVTVGHIERPYGLSEKQDLVVLKVQDLTDLGNASWQAGHAARGGEEGASPRPVVRLEIPPHVYEDDFPPQAKWVFDIRPPFLRFIAILLIFFGAAAWIAIFVAIATG